LQFVHKNFVVRVVGGRTPQTRGAEDAATT